MKRALNISLWLIFVSGVMFLMSFISSEHSKVDVPVKGAVIKIQKPGGHVLVTRDEILEEMDALGYDSVSAMGALNLGELETRLNQMPAIESCNVYKTVDGRLNISVLQRTPLVRIIHRNGISTYVDQHGSVFPKIQGHPTKLLVVNGHVNESNYRGKVFNFGRWVDGPAGKTSQIFALAKFIDQHELWKNQILQVYLNESDEFELVPRVGDHRIIFGSLDNMEKKFKKLEIFYREGLNYTDWNAFDTLNLKYRDQIVCTKK